MEPEDDILLEEAENVKKKKNLKTPFPPPRYFDLSKIYTPDDEEACLKGGLKVSPIHIHAFFRIANAYHSYGAPAPKVGLFSLFSLVISYLFMSNND